MDRGFDGPIQRRMPRLIGVGSNMLGQRASRPKFGGVAEILMGDN